MAATMRRWPRSFVTSKKYRARKQAAACGSAACLRARYCSSRTKEENSMQIEGKAAVVTGGGTGVGRATALELARRGCSVLINYSRSKNEAEETASEIAALGVKGIAVEADVADDAACRKMVGTAVREFGRLDVL